MTVQELWDIYSQKENIAAEYDAWAFGDDADRLARLVLDGIKTGTASAYPLYELEGEPLPEAGEYSVILDSKENAVCIIRTTKVYVVPFREVTAEHAFREGEGNRSLAYWRKVHEAFFTGELAEAGLSFDWDMPVVCEEFEKVFPVTEFEKGLEILDIPEEIAEILRSAYGRKTGYFQKQARDAYHGDAPDFPICAKAPLERLVIWCCCVPAVVSGYQALGIEDEVIQSTLWDITRRMLEYRSRFGKPGLSKTDVIWLRHIYNCELFQIGTLQYQLFHMVYLDAEGCGEDYMCFSSEQKQKLPAGSPVINIHIPAGADISDGAVEDSIEAAKGFFLRHYPDFRPRAFICYSWLLYPPMRMLLPPDSRISAFADRFQIIGQVRDPYGSDAVKRIYGKRYPKKALYPTDTSLRKNAVGNFSKLGMACGVIEIT